MKYKCTDGINRDGPIERYIELRAKSRAISSTMSELGHQLTVVSTEMSQIYFDQLGLVGMTALQEYEKQTQEEFEATTYMGRKISSLSREELMRALIHIAGLHQIVLENHRKDH